MTKKKNYCQKCAMRHCAPTGKKCTRNEEIAEKGIESEVGTPLTGLASKDTCHRRSSRPCSRSYDGCCGRIDERDGINAKTSSDSDEEKSHQPEPEESPVAESEGSGFIEVRLRKKKRSKRAHCKRYSIISNLIGLFSI